MEINTRMQTKELLVESSHNSAYLDFGNPLKVCGDCHDVIAIVLHNMQSAAQSLQPEPTGNLATDVVAVGTVI
ncbi:hypothetical protein T265_16300, partial [Opisthorchis viverrini]